MFVNRLTALLLLCVAAAPSFAQERAPSGMQSLEKIARAAESSLRATLGPGYSNVELEATSIDPRMRLPACAGKLESRAPMPRGTQSRAIVRVACTSGAPWNLNVPVEIRRRTDVLVMKRAAARGESLTAADVSIQSRVLPGLESQYIGQVVELAGRLTRRPIPSGTALTADALAATLLIHRGEKVTLAASHAGIEVRAPGVALADASLNQRVRVQNLNSLKIIEGVAETDG
ncbi:MAG: flagellar basal body P-ring formation protein FlgA, partial [Steroidobacteraceae bacterium]|nr:flagellar basal body P-ring formation protein FlgA [Steroidobacteraceae bacterium]